MVKLTVIYKKIGCLFICLLTYFPANAELVKQEQELNGPWQIYISNINDDKLFGLLDKALGHNANDNGYTNGTEIKFFKKINSELTLTVDLKSDLYTNRITTTYVDSSGQRVAQQHFVEDNVFAIIIDNKEAEELYYYRMGIGWHYINKERRNALLASGQQQFLHDHILRHLGVSKQWINISRDYQEHGLYFEANIGRKFKLNSNPIHSVEAMAEFGARGSAISAETVHAVGNAEVSYNYRYGNNYGVGTKLSFGTEVKKYNDNTSTNQNVYLGFSLGNKQSNCGTKYYLRKKSQSAKYLEFDNDNEDMLLVYCQTPIN